jgi:hypothetical protein
LNTLGRGVIDGRVGGLTVRFWAAVPELEGRYLRVITLEDKVTTPAARLTSNASF